MATDKITIVIDADAKDAINDFQKLNKQQEKQSKGLNKLKVGYAAVAAVLTGTVAVAIGRATKAAIDFEEAASKFDTVFKDVRNGANALRKDLVKNFGLSTKAATELLSATGDLLSGFGFTGQAALDLSGEVNKLAVDLASFTNAQGGAEAVSAALTKALLGERESLKTYGIAIQEADIQARLLAKGQKDLTGEALRQAKAYATLELALDQSKNAIGDFARTSGGTANQLRQIQATAEDLTIILGGLVLNAINPLVSGFNRLLKSFLPDEAINRTRKFREELENTQKTLNARLEILKRSDITEKTRSNTIKQVNEELRKLGLREVDAKTNIEELNKLQKESNRLLLQRIKLAGAQESIAKRQAEASELEAKNIEDQLLIEQKRIDIQTKLQGRNKKAAENLIDRLNADIALRNKRQEAIAKEIDQIVALTGATKDLNDIPPAGGDPEEVEERFSLFSEIYAKDRKKFEDEQFRKQQIVESVFGAIQTTVGAVFDFIAQKRQQDLDAQLAANNKELEDKVSQLEAQKEAGIISEEEFQSAKTAAEEKAQAQERALKKKAFDQEKKLKIIQIQINAALAVMSAFAQLGPIGGAIASIGIGATQIAQTAIVASQKFPAYARGVTDAPAGMALVGEQGPELINFSGGEEVIPAGPTSNIMNTTNNNNSNINITVETNDPEQLVNRLQSQYGVDIFGAGT